MVANMVVSFAIDCRADLSPVEQCLASVHHDPRARRPAASVKSPVTSPVAIPRPGSPGTPGHASE